MYVIKKYHKYEVIAIYYCRTEEKARHIVNLIIAEDYVKLNAVSTVLSYGGNVVNPGETVRFTLNFNPTGYQSVGIHSEPKGRLWNSPGYSAVMRLGFIELQRYNYNSEGEF